MIKYFTPANMPWKLDLVSKKTGKKFTQYRSMVIALAFDDEYFTYEETNQDKVQALSIRSITL